MEEGKCDAESVHMDASDHVDRTVGLSRTVDVAETVRDSDFAFRVESWCKRRFSGSPEHGIRVHVEGEGERVGVMVPADRLKPKSVDERMWTGAAYCLKPPQSVGVGKMDGAGYCAVHLDSGGERMSAVTVE